MTVRERRNWLRERQSGCGATDIASIAGVGYQSAADIYAEKIAPEPIDRAPMPIMRMGLATEPLNAELYAGRFLNFDAGDDLTSPGLMRSHDRDWMLATYDRVAEIDRKPETMALRAVELKYVRFFTDSWGDDGSDQIPDSHSIQATWQHAVLLSRYPSRRIDPPHVAALDSSGEQRVYTVQYSDRLAALLMELAEEFWRRVVNREEVGPDWRSPLSDRIAEACATIRPDTSVKLGEDAALLVEGMELSSESKDIAERNYKTLKAELRKLLGEIECGVLPDGRRVKQYPVAEKVITPKAYLREARVDVRVLAAPKAGGRDATTNGG